MVQAQKMDRGTDALKTHVDGMKIMNIRQTRRGWLQEILGCEAKTEFKYFKEGETAEFATSLNEDDCFCRTCCSAVYGWKAEVKEVSTGAELLTAERPCTYCTVGACKCCCYQELFVSSGGESMGSVKEECWYCIPTFTARGSNGDPLYKIHPPTCCNGCCVNCWAEGNPFTRQGCCKSSFRVYPHSQEDTDGDSPHIGMILKTPKSALVQVFTDADAFEAHFPDTATSGEKALLVGTTLFFNSLFFEGETSEV